MMNNRRFVKGFWQLADPKIWVASTVPMALGIALAVTTEPARFSFFWCLLAVAGVYLIEIGKNALNEFVDYRSGVDPAVDAGHRTPFSGGKKTIVDGLLTPRQTALIALATFGAAACIGMAVVLFREYRVLYIGMAGIALAIAYSLPPFKLCYRGLGEFAVGIAFGPLILAGMYLTLSHRVDVLPFFASLPLGLLITNVLWINQFPDFEADRSGNKRNWVVRLGKRKSVVWYGVLFALAYTAVGVTAWAALNPVWLIALLSAPMAWKAVKNAGDNYDDIPKLIASNAATVRVYMLTGLLLIAAALLDGYWT